MEKNELKKLLYIHKPIATLEFIRKGIMYYTTVVNDVYINFEVPVSDTGDADFFPHMESQHLIRWII